MKIWKESGVLWMALILGWDGAFYVHGVPREGTLAVWTDVSREG